MSATKRAARHKENESNAGYVREQGFGLNAIDTVNSAFGTGNENDTQDMTAFIAAVDEVREAGASMLLVHHSKKDDPTTPRGNSALYNAMETVWVMTADDKKKPYRILSNQKLKAGQLREDIGLKFRRITEKDGGSIFVETATGDDPALVLLENLIDVNGEVRRSAYK